MNGGVSDMYDFFETQTEKCLKVNLFTNPSVNIVSALKMSPENPLLLLSRPDPLKPLTVGRNDGTFFVPELSQGFQVQEIPRNRDAERTTEFQ